MGRPRVYEEPRQSLHVKLPAMMADTLRRLASRESAERGRQVSVNRLIERAVYEYLDRRGRTSTPPE